MPAGSNKAYCWKVFIMTQEIVLEVGQVWELRMPAVIGPVHLMHHSRNAGLVPCILLKQRNYFSNTIFWECLNLETSEVVTVSERRWIDVPLHYKDYIGNRIA